jgi:dTDP-4-dehydrorhamnose reductase
MEVWGGIECSYVRVHDARFDQLARSGHYGRMDDLERFAALGLKTLRYPLLWETAVTGARKAYDFRFADERVPRLRQLGIRIIAGLVHHGSGPDHAPVTSDRFAEGLAHYAGALARRHPEIESWVPVNEPLTTARFSGLYGHWHPHARDPRTFARILMNQCRATVLTMRAVRRVNPAAQLVQTDDLGTIYSTPALAYQAEFENERRWLGWDLLCGRVDARHAMYRELCACGVTTDELAWLRDNPCPPDIIGIDHYVTSDRYLDDDYEKYPPGCRGGNAFRRYADVEAVRVLQRPGTSLREIVLAAARRYHVPIALTEVHLGCSEVAEQVNWFEEVCAIALQLEATGVDLRAVTPWALLGAYDWDSLMTRADGTYESGAFCLRTGEPRCTALGHSIELRARGREGRDTSREAPWWRRPERLLYGGGRTSVNVGRSA